MEIKDTILAKFEKALTMELDVNTVVEMAKVVAMFEANDVAMHTANHVCQCATESKKV